MARRFSDILHDAHKVYDAKGKKKKWILQPVFDKLLEYWESEEFIKASITNSANRNHISHEGRAHGKHTGGSRSFHDARIVLEKTLKRPVSAVELYMYTHTNKKDKRPIDDNALQVEELFKEKVPDILPFLGKQNTRIPDGLLKEADKQFVECVGGVKNGRITGLGNLSLEYRGGSTMRSVPSEVLTQLSEENSKLREDLSAVRQSLDEERHRSASTQEKMQAEITRIDQLVSKFLSTTSALDCDSHEES